MNPNRKPCNKTLIEILVDYINENGTKQTNTFEYGLHTPYYQEDIDLPLVLQELYKDGCDDAMEIIHDIKLLADTYPDTISVKVYHVLDLKSGTHIHSLINDMYLNLAKEDLEQYIVNVQDEYKLEPSQIKNIVLEISRKIEANTQN